MTEGRNGVDTSSKVIWKDASGGLVYDLDRTADLGWTDLSAQATTSLKAKFAIIGLRLKADTIGTGNYCELGLRKNGTGPAENPKLVINKVAAIVGVWEVTQVIIGLDENQVFEYEIDVGTGWQIDSDIDCLGYIE